MDRGAPNGPVTIFIQNPDGDSQGSKEDVSEAPPMRIGGQDSRQRLEDAEDEAHQPLPTPILPSGWKTSAIEFIDKRGETLPHYVFSPKSLLLIPPEALKPGEVVDFLQAFKM